MPPPRPPPSPDRRRSPTPPFESPRRDEATPEISAPFDVRNPVNFPVNSPVNNSSTNPFTISGGNPAYPTLLTPSLSSTYQGDTIAQVSGPSDHAKPTNFQIGKIAFAVEQPFPDTSMVDLSMEKHPYVNTSSLPLTTLKSDACNSGSKKIHFHDIATVEVGKQVLDTSMVDLHMKKNPLINTNLMTPTNLDSEVCSSGSKNSPIRDVVAAGFFWPPPAAAVAANQPPKLNLQVMGFQMQQTSPQTDTHSHGSGSSSSLSSGLFSADFTTLPAVLLEWTTVLASPPPGDPPAPAATTRPSQLRPVNGPSQPGPS